LGADSDHERWRRNVKNEGEKYGYSREEWRELDPATKAQTRAEHAEVASRVPKAERERNEDAARRASDGDSAEDD
jgi:hypothetical protein